MRQAGIERQKVIANIVKNIEKLDLSNGFLNKQVLTW